MKYIPKLAALCLVLLFALPIPVLAATGAALDFEQSGSVTVTLTSADDGSSPTNGTLTLYAVAELCLQDGDMAYVLTQDFADCGQTLDDLTGEALATALAEYALAQSLSGTEVEIDSEGTAVFEDLPLGLYLVVQTTRSTGYYPVESFLVTVPLEEGEVWVYDVDASPKVALYTQPEEPDTPDDSTPSTPSDPTLPQTGQLNWPVVALALGGLVLIVLGLCLTRGGKKHHAP